MYKLYRISNIHIAHTSSLHLGAYPYTPISVLSDILGGLVVVFGRFRKLLVVFGVTYDPSILIGMTECDFRLSGLALAV